MPEVRLLTGPYRSGRAQAIDTLLLDRWGKALLIVPTRRAAALRSQSLLESSAHAGLMGRTVFTFPEFAAALLQNTSENNPRVDTYAQRIILQKAITDLRETGRLEELGESVDTQGFFNHVQHIITQLKQAAVDPHDFRERIAKRRRPSPFDDIVAELYAAYQRQLLTGHVYDMQGMFWIADLVTRRERPQILDGVEALLLDGFEDFTPSEFRLLSGLRTHLDLLVIGLNYDPSPNRRDLYTLPRHTAERVRREFAAKEDVYREDAPKTLVHFASSSFFWREAPQRPEGLAENIRFFGAHDLLHEVETAGRHIKKLVREEKTALENIAIVHPAPREITSTLRDVFGDMGIPTAPVDGPRLSESSIAAFVIDLLEGTQRWKHEDVIDLLASHWFPREEEVDSGLADLYPRVARAARIVSGRKQWREGLDALSERLEKSTDEEAQQFLRHVPQLKEACASFQRCLEVLDPIVVLIPSKAPMHEFARRTDAVLDALALEQKAYTFEPASGREFETAALQVLREILGTLYHWTAEDGESLTRSDYIAHLRQAFQISEVYIPEPRSSVRCFDLQSIRNLEFDYVFFLGANEGSIPAPPRLNSLYGDEDLEDLRRTGIDVENAAVHAQREALLFHRVFDLPRRELIISWHTALPDGKAIGPSPYVQDVLELMPECERTDDASSLIPALELAASWSDLRKVAFGTVHELRDEFPEKMRLSAMGASVEQERYSARPLGTYDGVIARTDLVAGLANDFGSDHKFSAGQVETYLDCPFRFFSERILHILQLDPPSDEFDPLVRGSILHTVLERFHRRYAQQSVANIPHEEATNSMDTMIDEAFHEMAWRAGKLGPGIVEMERRRMTTALRRYLVLERDRSKDWIPSYFETAFGRAGGEEGSELSRDEPFSFKTQEGNVLFSGRIDRIDRKDDEASVIDYKSTLVDSRELSHGNSVQLLVYALALESDLLPDAPCTLALFLQPGRKKTTLLFGPRTRTNRETHIEVARNAITNAVKGIRSGRFHPALEHDSCKYCPVGKACRYEQGRLDRKSPNDD